MPQAVEKPKRSSRKWRWCRRDEKRAEAGDIGVITKDEVKTVKNT